jgi:thiosulfate/3-mercaptopyruvate sulfurtransferase
MNSGFTHSGITNFLWPKAVVYFLMATLFHVGIGCELSASPQQQTGGTETGIVDESPLLTAAELHGLIVSGKEGICILEPGKKVSDYRQGHVPNALFVHWVDDMTDPDNSDRYNVPQPEQFAALMSRLGIKDDDQIIIYDRMSSRLSTRLFWTLKYFRHKDVKILDGGFAAWKKQFELSKDISTPEKTSYKIDTVQSDIVAQIEFVKGRLNDRSVRMVDGRPVAQFTGEKAGKVFHTAKEHSRKGHVPDAVSIFWQDNFNNDGTFRSTEQLRALYQNAGVLPDQCVVTYCNEGLHAAPPWFVMTQLLGYKDVRLYDSSMAEWAESDSPIDSKK